MAASTASAAPALRPEVVEQLVEVWRADPVAYFEDVFGLTPWTDPEGYDDQVTILRAAPESPQMSTRSGHKVAKTCSAGGLAWWAATVWGPPGTRVICTAPTNRQVDEAVWREIGILYRRAQARGIPIGGKLNTLPSSGWAGPEDRQILGFSPENANAFSGISAPLVVYIVDEHFGVDERVWEAILANAAGDAFVWGFGNPTELTGQAYRTFHEESGDWRTLHISSRRTPNVRAGRTLIKGLATQPWIERRERAWPEDIVKIRIDGDFPEGGLKAVVTLALCVAAKARWTPEAPIVSWTQSPPRLCVGVDCARFGDDLSTIVPVRGAYQYPIEIHQKQDTVEIAQHARRLALERAREVPWDKRKPRLHIDTIGIGAGVADTAVRFGDVEVVEVNSSERPNDPDLYCTLRDELAFGVTRWLKEGGQLHDRDGQLQPELLAQTYTFRHGCYLVESKDELKKKLKRSPDRADGLALAVYRPPPGRGVRTTRVKGL